MKYIVSKNSKDKPNFDNLNDAIDKSEDFDEIIIKSGIYEEYFTISKKIKIIGEGFVKIIFDKEKIDNLIFINETCELINLTIETNDIAIQIYSCFDVIIKNCNIHSKNKTAISVFGSGDFLISESLIYAKEYCIQFNNLFDNFGYIKKSKLSSYENTILITKNAILKIYNTEIYCEKKYNIILRNESQVHLEKSLLVSPDANIKLRDNNIKKNVCLIQTKACIE